MDSNADIGTQIVAIYAFTWFFRIRSGSIVGWVKDQLLRFRKKPATAADHE